MHCDSDRLADISKEIKGLPLNEIYTDWANSRVCLLFGHSCKKAMLTIKNNGCAGISILEPISNYSKCQIKSEEVQSVK